MASEESQSSKLKKGDRIVICRGGDSWKHQGTFVYKIMTQDDDDYVLESESIKSINRFVTLHEDEKQVGFHQENGSVLKEAYYVFPFSSSSLHDLELKGVWRSKTAKQPIVVTQQKDKKEYSVQCDDGESKIKVKNDAILYGEWHLQEGDDNCLVWMNHDQKEGIVKFMVWSRIEKHFNQIQINEDERCKVDHLINRNRHQESMKNMFAKHGKILTYTTKVKESKFRAKMAEKLKGIEVETMYIPVVNVSRARGILQFVQDEANVRIFDFITEQEYELKIVGHKYSIEMAKVLIGVKLQELSGGESKEEEQGSQKKFAIFRTSPETQIKNLEDTIKKLEEKNKKLKSENKSLGKQNKSVKDENKSLGKQNISLGKQNKVCEADMFTLKEKRRELKESCEKYRTHLTAASNRYDEQQRDLDRERDTSSYYKNELTNEIQKLKEEKIKNAKLLEECRVLDHNYKYYVQEAEKFERECTRLTQKLEKSSKDLADSRDQEKRQKKQASELLAKVNSLLKIKDVNGSSATADVSIAFPLPGDVVTVFNALKAEGRVDMFEYLDELDDYPFKGGEQCRKLVNNLFRQCIQEAADEHAEIKRKFSDALKVGKEFNQATSSFLANYLKVNYQNQAFFNPKNRMEEVAKNVFSSDELKAVDLSGTVVSEFLQESLKLGWIMALSTPSFQIGEQDDGSYEDSCYDPAPVYGSRSPGGYYIWPCLVQGEVRSRGYYVRDVGEQGARGGTDEAKDSKDVKGLKEHDVSVADNQDPNTMKKPDKDGSDEQNVNGENKANVAKDKQCQCDGGEPEVQIE